MTVLAGWTWDAPLSALLPVIVVGWLVVLALGAFVTWRAAR